MEYRTLMKAKATEAYKRVCEALGEDPEQGLDETEESLIGVGTDATKSKDNSAK